MPSAANSSEPASTLEAASPPTGQAAAPNDLAGALYADLRAIAASYFSRQAPGHTLQPTALVNEAMLRILRDDARTRSGRWNSPGHFLAVAATAMRQILVDYARASNSLKRGGQGTGVQVDSATLAAPRPALDVLDLDDAINRLSAVDERAGRVVVLRFFAGLTIAQTAEALGVSDFTVENDWRFARAFLARDLAALPRDARG